MTRLSQSIELAAPIPAGEALRRICRQQLGAIEAHLPGTRQGRDAEELHDLRVAVRRTRSALGEFHKVFPGAQLQHFRTEFRWLGEVTGPVRDLDVYLEHLPAYRALLPADAATALEPFRGFLRSHRRAERRSLLRRLASPRLARLLAEWQRFLAATDGTEWPATAAWPAGEMARRHIWMLYRRFLRQGAAIRDRSPDHDLHRLRITGKKLRYLVEFFRSLYPPEEIALLLKAMKRIQDFLGSYQDLTVQQQHLGELARQMQAEGGADPATVAALELLVNSLRKQQQGLRQEFPEHFRVFSHGRGRRGFNRLFAPLEIER
jgi:CHAD domain-containing protein